MTSEEKTAGSVATDTAIASSELVALTPVAVTPDDRPSPVLFDVPDAATLPALIAELRRLGVGGVAVRWLPSQVSVAGVCDPGSEKTGSQTPATEATAASC